MKSKLFVGIDVSKGYADFYIINEFKVVMEPGFQLDDNLEGYERLRTILERYWKMDEYDMIYCACESTGGYEDCWLKELVSVSDSIPLKVSRVNPKAVKGMSDAALNRTITDQVSAESIANYLVLFHEELTYLSSDNTFREARSHYRFIKMLMKQKVQLKNQLEKILYQHYGVMLDYCRAHTPNWLLQMLSRYGSAQNVVKAGVKKLVKIPGLSEAKARLVIEKSMRIGSTSKHIEFLIEQTSLEILHRIELIEKNTDHLVSLFKDKEEIKLLMTIPGIALKTAVLLMIEIEDISRFDEAKKLAAYLGVNPQFKQSGDGTWAFHMSKKGRSAARAILYTSALCGLKYNLIIKQRYASARAKGKNHYDAMGVVMHKLLRIVFGVLKKRRAFSAEIDQSNQEKAQEKQKNRSAEENKIKSESKKRTRRYQIENLSNVPVSRRTAQKRKQMAGPNLTKELDNPGSPPSRQTYKKI
jgi:transposase